MPSATFLNPLKDLSNKVALSPQLEETIREVVTLDETAPQFATRVSSLSEELLGYLDAEQAKLTEQRIALGDPNSLRQRLLGDPRRQVDQTLAALKGRFQAEKSEWSRRLQKQQAELLDSVDLELRKLTPETRIEGDRGLTDVPEKFKHTFPMWIDEALANWGKHLGSLLPAKLQGALATDYEILSRQLGETVAPRISRPAAMNQTPTRIEFVETLDSSEVPTTMEAFFETFKNGLNTVAMLAGLVIIPVVGSFTDQTGTIVRAAIISAFLLPVVLFTFVQTRNQRAKLIGRLTEKAQEKIRKALEQYAKTRIDRFAKEADRHVGNWLSAVQTDLVTEIDGQISSAFGRKEAGVAAELAKVALMGDRLQDQLMSIKQARTMVATSIAPEAKRRLAARGPS